MHTSSLFALVALTSALQAQQVLLPSTHHLSESAIQTSGTEFVFRTTAGRFQVIYDASHFTATGVVGPIVLENLRFRGEDTEQNLGGHQWINCTIAVGATSLTGPTMSATFATNRDIATTTMSTALTGVTIVEDPSLGTAPNNYHIDVDVSSLAFALDPSSARPNLLIDITMPTAPAPITDLILTQDTTGTAAQVGGSCLTASTPLATSGITINPPVLNVEFLGAGGNPTLIPARVEAYGAACGGRAATFYQAFPHNQRFDLHGGGMTLSPDNPVAPNYYIVSGQSLPVDVTKVNAAPNSVDDDALVTHPLGFTFNYPGGSTTTIKPCTNGFVWLAATPTGIGANPDLTSWLGATATELARVAPLWHDFHAGRNTASHPNSGMHVLTDTSGGVGNAVCYVTWLQVGRFNTVSGIGLGGQSVNTMQCVLRENSRAIEFRYGTMDELTGSSLGAALHGIVGFTRGRIGGTTPSIDPQSRDLSIEMPF
ncbi:MAG: hypothetical protein ABIP94_11320, partial [Planctomycetota bacterium]